MEKNSRAEIINILCNLLGLEPDDVDVTDSMIDDLHMSPAVISEFMEVLEEKGYEVGKLDMEEVYTLQDLFEILGIEEE